MREVLNGLNKYCVNYTKYRSVTHAVLGSLNSLLIKNHNSLGESHE